VRRRWVDGRGGASVAQRTKMTEQRDVKFIRSVSLHVDAAHRTTLLAELAELL
jgi:hypothetical protein